MDTFSAAKSFDAGCPGYDATCAGTISVAYLNVVVQSGVCNGNFNNNNNNNGPPLLFMSSFNAAVTSAIGTPSVNEQF
jgi:hypothetical protein